MSDLEALVCAVMAGKKIEDQIPGTVASVCRECGTGVWIAPSGQAMRKAMGDRLHVLCVPCGMTNMIRSNQVPNPPTEEQIDELIDYYRRKGQPDE